MISSSSNAHMSLLNNEVKVQFAKYKEILAVVYHFLFLAHTLKTHGAPPFFNGTAGINCFGNTRIHQRIKSFLMDLEVESEFLYLVVLTVVNRLGSQVHVGLGGGRRRPPSGGGPAKGQSQVNSFYGGVGLPKGNGGVQRFPLARRRLALECKGRRKLDCKTHPLRRDEKKRKTLHGGGDGCSDGGGGGSMVEKMVVVEWWRWWMVVVVVVGVGGGGGGCGGGCGWLRRRDRVQRWTDPDRTTSSRHHHPCLLPPSDSPLYLPIWYYMGEFCWKLWVARAPNGLTLFCRHAVAFPVGIETFSDCGCAVGIRFGELFQAEFLSTPLLLG
uniref:Uncharacterized protein n=1 Tax=Fagus sylvatica TaxID=28930 RepID=A0A2N9H7G0_FAGSY